MSATKMEDDPAALQRMTPSEFKAEVVRKGWTYVELGERWQMSANWIAKVAARADRARYWDDAIRGLPDQNGSRAHAREA